MDTGMNRRDMLRIGAAAGVVAGLTTAGWTQENRPPVKVGMIGTGARSVDLLQSALAAGVEVPALCDINRGNLDKAIEAVAKARGGRKPVGYSDGPKDYQRMLKRDDLEAVVIAVPIPLHAGMAIDAMRAGKHVLSEVAAAMTLDECWGLVRTTEETGRLYMLAENCCYFDDNMMIRNIVRQGLFGKATYAECGYVHDCRGYLFQQPNGQLTWRGELTRDFCGNWYPTHALGPVAQWLGINRGDRLVSLVAGCSGQASLRDFVDQGYAGAAARQIRFKGADSITVLIRTAKGALIDVRFDICSSHPLISTTYYSLQGTKASYESRTNSIWIAGRSKHDAWEPASNYAKEFRDRLWTHLPKRHPGGPRLGRLLRRVGIPGCLAAGRPVADRLLRRRGLERGHPAFRQVDRRRRQAPGNPRLYQRQMGDAKMKKSPLRAPTEGCSGDGPGVRAWWRSHRGFGYCVGAAVVLPPLESAGNQRWQCNCHPRWPDTV